MRCNTILRLLTLIATEQHDFFCSGGTLTPITMQQMAEKNGHEHIYGKPCNTE